MDEWNFKVAKVKKHTILHTLSDISTLSNVPHESRMDRRTKTHIKPNRVVIYMFKR